VFSVSNVPVPHAVHVSEPALERHPSGHAGHAIDGAAPENVPASHVSQVDLPEPAVWEPTPQFKQPVCASTFWYVPASHDKHSENPVVCA
jgi:FtsP/CotA-like multicopper oxidase with cupredoxin domain